MSAARIAVAGAAASSPGAPESRIRNGLFPRHKIQFCQHRPGHNVAEERFLSRETKTDIDELVIRKGWLLLTCSGTIGRLFYVTERMDGWVATHDLIRIVPHAGVSIGFLHAYLSSAVAQKQIMGHTHGGQIDHVTHHQVGGVLVPELPGDQVKEIHKQMMDALRQRERAIAQVSEIADSVEQGLKKRAANARR